MARPLRLEVADGIHHVTARSNAEVTLFADDVDRRRFLRCFETVLADAGWFSLAYCLMGTHYHLLVETPEPNLADGMRDLNSSYARAWRDRRDNRGRVFAGPYFSKLVQTDAYLLVAARYVVLNPVAAHLCRRPDEWAWSSFRDTCRGATSPVLHPARLLRFFDERRTEARVAYRRFVEDETVPEYDVQDNGLLGDVPFALAHIPEELPSRCIPSRFLTPRRPPLETILAGRSREEGAVVAHVEHGYVLREIADTLGVHRSTVCRWVRRRATNWT
jgi:REP element-mobilizing transposase RayT